MYINEKMKMNSGISQRKDDLDLYHQRNTTKFKAFRLRTQQGRRGRTAGGGERRV